VCSATAAGRVDGAEPRVREGGAPRRRFADVLARAGEGRAGDRAKAPAPKGRTPGSGPAPPMRRKAPFETDKRPDDSPPGGSPAAGPGPRGSLEASGAAELRACLRAAPAVIAASLRPGDAELALSFGAALSLDLRSSAQGLELTLRPASGLERVTRAELPGLVEALRARGLRVARAEVRPRAPAPPRGAR